MPSTGLRTTGTMCSLTHSSGPTPVASWSRSRHDCDFRDAALGRGNLMVRYFGDGRPLGGSGGLFGPLAVALGARRSIPHVHEGGSLAGKDSSPASSTRSSSVSMRIGSVGSACKAEVRAPLSMGMPPFSQSSRGNHESNFRWPSGCPWCLSRLPTAVIGMGCATW
jgi:hypothetical protein